MCEYSFFNFWFPKSMFFCSAMSHDGWGRMYLRESLIDKKDYRSDWTGKHKKSKTKKGEKIILGIERK